jgi:hypothetical protein
MATEIAWSRSMKEGPFARTTPRMLVDEVSIPQEAACSLAALWND